MADALVLLRSNHHFFGQAQSGKFGRTAANSHGNLCENTKRPKDFLCRKKEQCLKDVRCARTSDNSGRAEYARVGGYRSLRVRA
jgi:hypothetical protein